VFLPFNNFSWAYTLLKYETIFLPLAIVYEDYYNTITYPGFIQLEWNGEVFNASEREIIVTTVSYANSTVLFNYLLVHENMTVNITDGDYNYWYEYYYSDTYTTMEVILVVLNFAIIILIVVRFILHFTTNAKAEFLSIISFFLMIELLGCIARLFFILVCQHYKPLVMTVVVNETFITMGMPFSIISTLLLTLYWIDMIYNANLKRLRNSGQFLMKMKIPFIVFSVFISLVEAVTIYLRVKLVTNNSYDILTAVYRIWISTITIVIHVCLFIFGLRVLQIIQHRNAYNTKKRSNKLLRSTIVLLTSTIGCLGYIAVFIVLIIVGFNEDYILLQELYFLFLSIATLPKIISFYVNFKSNNQKTKTSSSDYQHNKGKNIQLDESNRRLELEKPLELDESNRKLHDNHLDDKHLELDESHLKLHDNHELEKHLELDLEQHVDSNEKHNEEEKGSNVHNGSSQI